MKTQPRFWIPVFLCLFWLALPPVQAQAVSPWFRGGKQVWETLLKHNPALVSGRAALSIPLSHTVTGFSVKTTPYNWLLHRVSHSGVFSRMEKEILLQKTSSEKAALGKLAYFHDRDAHLFNALSLYPQAQADEPAFWRHQNLLTNTLAELEEFYRPLLPEKLTSSLFTKEAVQHLLADPVQPPAFVLHVKEISSFAALNTLAEQQAWARNILHQTNSDLNALLAKDPQTLKGYEFERYYLQKLRLEYFKTLQEVLQNAVAKRPSLIIRRKRVLKINLPGAGQPMTDAQRLGFLRYYMDRLARQADLTQKENPAFAQYLQVKTVLQTLAPVYETYAAAEAFGVPYEHVLRVGPSWPDLIVGAEEGQQLRQTIGKTPLTQLPAKIDELKSKMALMQAQEPDGLDFFVRYYRLERTKALYETFLIRERLLRGT